MLHAMVENSLFMVFLYFDQEVTQIYALWKMVNR
jgi:hypothetical protein